MKIPYRILVLDDDENALAGIVELAKQKAKRLHDQANAFQELSSSLAFDD